ncbi:DUF2141 domain-containing protein [Lutibacter sp.]|uniref:DUF2141 domain-containing protein n=1 Tax=Lutibacter sp. TaxID=1925666 RepID=UPI0025C6FD2C|nr:DUF2141 domain-containing protein [Lutibacter sp.]MCF6181647.1 DUF2141 domain-containing protein [Lutibacter sp.]
MQQLILTLVLVLSSVVTINVQDKVVKESTVTVTVINALSDKGTIKFALYTQENFMKTPLQSISSTIKNGVSKAVFKNVAVGEYAIICYHDENENNRLDFDERGIPIESFGTSNNVMEFGPPQFESAKFEVLDKNVTLEIKF